MTQDQINQIERAIRLISHGENQPAGLEMLAMSIAGEGCYNSLSGAILQHAEATERAADTIASGLQAIADAIADTVLEK